MLLPIDESLVELAQEYSIFFSILKLSFLNLVECYSYENYSLRLRVRCDNLTKQADLCTIKFKKDKLFNEMSVIKSCELEEVIYLSSQ
jgi:hypothetical protein